MIANEIDLYTQTRRMKFIYLFCTHEVSLCCRFPFFIPFSGMHASGRTRLCRHGVVLTVVGKIELKNKRVKYLDYHYYYYFTKNLPLFY